MEIGDSSKADSTKNPGPLIVQLLPTQHVLTIQISATGRTSARTVNYRLVLGKCGDGKLYAYHRHVGCHVFGVPVEHNVMTYLWRDLKSGCPKPATLPLKLLKEFQHHSLWTSGRVPMVTMYPLEDLLKHLGVRRWQISASPDGVLAIENRMNEWYQACMQVRWSYLIPNVNLGCFMAWGVDVMVGCWCSFV